MSTAGPDALEKLRSEKLFPGDRLIRLQSFDCSLDSTAHRIRTLLLLEDTSYLSNATNSGLTQQNRQMSILLVFLLHGSGNTCTFLNKRCNFAGDKVVGL